MTSTPRSSLLRFGAVFSLLVVIPACSQEIDEVPAEQQQDVVHPPEAAAAPAQLDAQAERALAEQGDIDAQGRLASEHYYGSGAAQDFSEALRWARLAAYQGSAVGQGILASAYNTGRGVEQDYEEALRWARLAAEQGDPAGQTVLASLHRRGDGVEQDAVEAVRLYRLAAEQGLPSAQAILGMMYLAGEGVERDFVTAYAWLLLGSADPAVSVPVEMVAGLLTPEQIAEAEARAREWGP